MDGVISKMKTEEMINKLANRVIEITQQTQRENGMKKQTNNQSFRDL